MFNLFPGQGLGFSGSREIAFGLAPMVEILIPDITIIGGGFGYRQRVDRVRVLDNELSRTEQDDQEVVLIMRAIYEVIDA